MMRALALVALLAGCATPAAPVVEPVQPAAQAAPVCALHDGVIERLAERYGEQRVAWGMSSAKTMVEVIATKDGATWTIIVTDPGGMSCLVAAGEGWRNMDPVRREMSL